MRLELEVAAPTPPAALPQTEDATREAREALHSGIKAAQSGDRAKARESLMRSVALDARSETAWLWLASISEYPEELLVFLNNVLDINPGNARALEWVAATNSLLSKTFVQRGIDAHLENRLDFASECFNKALEYDQRNAAAWMWLASLADSDQGKITYLERVLEIEPENQDAVAALESAKSSINEMLLASAKQLAVSGQKAEALEVVEALLAETPRCTDGWMLKIHLVDGFDEKVKCFESVLAYDPSNVAASAGRDSLLALIGVQPAPAVESVTEPPSDDVQGPSQEAIEEAHHGSTLLVEHTEVIAAEVSEPNYSVVAAALDQESLEAPGTAEQYSEASHQEESVHLHVDAPGSDFVEPSVFSPEPAESYEPPPVPAASFVTPESSIPSPVLPLPEQPSAPTGFETTLVRDQEPSDDDCPYCGAVNGRQAISCDSCLAVLTLSDLEVLLANQNADKRILHEAVDRIERERTERQLTEAELITLGIAHLNLRNLQFGYTYLHEASQFNPNNVMLGRQVNALLMRLEEIRAQEEAQGRITRGKKILVVDDSPTVRKLISGKLEKVGHEVVCADDGVTALEKLADLVPDLILLDITMPRMDGYQVCKQIRSNAATRDVPVVMISGKDGFFDKVRGRMAGTSGYITKPFGPETLMKAVEMYLSGHGAEDVG